MTRKALLYCFFLLFSVSAQVLQAQMITGVWKGRIGTGLKAVKVELKLVQKGDSLTGTSYYYESPGNYRRYAIKGYFHPQNNTVVWWDDELIEQQFTRVRLLSPGEIPLLAEADFNCPGGGVMMLDGKAVQKTDQKEKGPLHFDKVEQSNFPDEWDYVIENYTAGGNDPDLIDSTSMAWKRTKPLPGPEPAVVPQQQAEPVVTVPAPQPPPAKKEPEPAVTPGVKDTVPVLSKTEADPVVPRPATLPGSSVKVPGIQDKFTERRKVLTTELPLAGDTIELHFYDNAEIDGDSISLFLNNVLVFEHVRLSDKPHIVRFAVSELSENNELVMVAENLGSIPPNTSYMIAYVNGQRYTANLESTERSSAMIRFTRRKEPSQ
jgi:hypothetical protein